MRLILPLGFYAAALLVAAACGSGTDLDCFESGATSYDVRAPGDTTVSFRWPGAFMPVRYYAEPVGELPANVDDALQLWANAFRCEELTLQRVADSALADIIIRNPSQLPPATALSFPADSVGACIGRTDIRIDSLDQLERPTRVWVAPQNIDPVAVAACYHFVVAHEVGHTLGLFAHSPRSADLMYAVPRKRELSIDDRYTIQLLYHRAGVTITPEPR